MLTARSTRPVLRVMARSGGRGRVVGVRCLPRCVPFAEAA